MKHLHLSHHGNIMMEAYWIGHDHPVLDVLHMFDHFYYLVVLFVDVHFGLCWCWLVLVVPEGMWGLLIVILYELFEDSDVHIGCCHGDHWVDRQICHKVCSFCCVGQLEETCQGDWGKILGLWCELRGVCHNDDFVEAVAGAFAIFRFVAAITLAAIANVTWTIPFKMSI